MVAWLTPINQLRTPSKQLFCFPYAGGGASIFRPWKNYLGPEIGAYAIQLPGRESRFTEEPISDLITIAKASADAISEICSRPFAIFGHSLGAAIAYEVTAELEARGLKPAQLFISGRQSPNRKPLRAPISHLSDAEFIEQLKSYNTTPREIFENREILELLLPMLKADFSMAENYQHQIGSKVNAPITALASKGDIWLSPESISDWSKKTFGPFSSHWFEGGHLYLNQETEALVKYIQEKLLKDPLKD